MNRDPFWIVWCPTNPSHPPVVRHPSREVAEAEAQRLARSNRGQPFIVLEAVTGFLVDDMRRVDFGSGPDPVHGDDDIPF